MAPVTFHGGPLHGHTVDAEAALVGQGGTYRLDGLSALYSAPQGVPVEIRPAAPAGAVAPTVEASTGLVETEHERAHREAVERHPAGKGRNRQVTRR